MARFAYYAGIAWMLLMLAAGAVLIVTSHNAGFWGELSTALGCASPACKLVVGGGLETILLVALLGPLSLPGFFLRRWGAERLAHRASL